jgi:signal transduction histidine kinase
MLIRYFAAARAAAIGNVTEVEPVLAAFMRTFEKIYRDRDIRFSLEIETPLRFRGEKQDLEEMVGNLVDNAGKWAASEVRIRVEAAAQSDHPVRPGLDPGQMDAGLFRHHPLDP